MSKPFYWTDAHRDPNCPPPPGQPNIARRTPLGRYAPGEQQRVDIWPSEHGCTGPTGWSRGLARFAEPVWSFLSNPLPRISRALWMIHPVLAPLSESEKAILMEPSSEPLRLACYLRFRVVQREIMPSAHQSVPDCVNCSPALVPGHSSNIYLEREMIRPSSSDATLVPNKRHFVIRRLPSFQAIPSEACSPEVEATFERQPF